MRLRTGHILGAAAVCATTFATAVPARADTLTVIASGAIGSSCTIAVQSPFTGANFAANGSVTAQALVNCNTGFKVTATSANGAARNSTPVPSGAPFVNNLPYTLAMSVPLESGGPLAASCVSGTLAAGQASCTLSPAGSGLSSAGKSAINRTATLTASWTAPALPARLIAGSYSDTLTISIASVP